MTISSVDIKAGPYACNGVLDDFDFAFKTFSAEQVRVVLTDADGVETDLEITTDYTVALNADQNGDPGGTIATVAVYATGYKITIVSNADYKQETDLTSGGGFYPDTIENMIDKLTLEVQQLQEQIERAVKIDISSTTTPDDLLDTIINSAAAASASATAAAASATAAATAETNAEAAQAAAEAAQAAAETAEDNIDTAIAEAIALKVDKTSNTGSALLPIGTTAQRDGGPTEGATRVNNETNTLETYVNGAWRAAGQGATGGGTDRVFIENDQTVNSDYTISTNRNAISVGPITIASGKTVTIPSGSSWVIL